MCLGCIVRNSAFIGQCRRLVAASNHVSPCRRKPGKECVIIPRRKYERSGCPSVLVHHAATWFLIILCFFSSLHRAAATRGKKRREKSTRGIYSYHNLVPARVDSSRDDVYTYYTFNSIAGVFVQGYVVNDLRLLGSLSFAGGYAPRTIDSLGVVVPACCVCCARYTL